MVEVFKRIFAYGLAGAVSLWLAGWGARNLLEDAKAEFKVEILGDVREWRNADMEVIRSIKEDTAIIKQALIAKGVGK